ncbi:hypothetical protein VTP01DRAFT_2026 [Rhizomucor pusillus]|uniref:uncharacterized protein n=1 Tax=Rhizomucor pusillus TaxID=4840 RepID=UPI0037445BFF
MSAKQQPKRQGQYAVILYEPFFADCSDTEASVQSISALIKRQEIPHRTPAVVFAKAGMKFFVTANLFLLLVATAIGVLAAPASGAGDTPESRVTDEVAKLKRR